MAMGGKGGVPEAPDYGPLAAASERSAELAYKTAQEQLAWAKQVYADNKAVGDQIIDFALGQMDKQSAWADADRKRYEGIYQPLEDQAALRAQDYASEARQEMEAGKAEADVAAQFEQARAVAQDRLEQFGVDPSQTRAGALDLGTRIAEAAAQASAGNQARFRTEQYGDQLMANAINTGKGYPQQVLGAAAQAGQSGNQAVNTGLATTASGAQTMGTGYQWQGMGNQAIGQWGQILNAGFQNQLDAWKAKQEAGSGWGSALGMAASFIPMMIQEGGVIPEEGGGDQGQYLPEEMSPSGGAIPDDIDAEIGPEGRPAKLNAGEFVVPKDVVGWLGEKGLQQIILKARKEMGNPEQAPAQPEMGPPEGEQQQQPMIPPRGIGAIPELEGP
jgi:hypothetical protein